MTVLEELLALQAVDTEIAQIEFKAAHLPEAETLREAERQLASVEAARRQVDEQMRTLATKVEANEASVVELRRQAERLNGQLRTVIAPREAEALQHEIVLLSERMSALDEESLGAIERSEELEEELRKLAGREEEARVACLAARDSLGVVRSDTKAQLDDAKTRRTAVATTIEQSWLSRYDAKRRDLAAVAVARLVRSTCGGCHLDLSPTEVDSVKRQPPEERECPNCTRWLVL